MPDTVAQIKERLDVVEVISGYLKLTKAGANYKARCPFHSEKTPSFSVSPERQSWHCFGCNKGGDMFSFVQEIDGVEFPEALRTLAARAGVEVPERGGTDRGAAAERERLTGVCELAAKFFAKQLREGTNGAKALAYLRERGVTDATVASWRLGWAPNEWRALTAFLLGSGVARHDIVAAGLAVENSGRPYDRFRSRIMFPICDGQGRVIGFAGRVFGVQTGKDGTPLAKYVNTPQTPVYDKSRALYGLHLAKAGIRERGSVLLVEGNMDALMAWQAGATNAVAVSGTALTDSHLRLLARHSTTLDLCLDADAAGQTATRRAVGLALAHNFSVRALALDDPEAKDPADYVARHGVKFAELATTAKPVMEYYYDRATAGYDPASAASKKSLISSLAPFIRRLPSKVEADHWIGQLAVLMRSSPESVRADVASAKDDLAVSERAEPAEETTGANVPTAPPDAASMELLALAAAHPDLAPGMKEAAALCDARVAAVLAAPELLTHPDDASRMLVERAHELAARLYPPDGGPEPGAQLAALTNRLAERDVRTRRAALAGLIRQAEQAKDTRRRDELVGQFQSLTDELNRLQSFSPSSPTTA